MVFDCFLVGFRGFLAKDFLKVGFWGLKKEVEVFFFQTQLAGIGSVLCTVFLFEPGVSFWFQQIEAHEFL